MGVKGEHILAVGPPQRIEFLEIHNSSRNQKQIQKATNHRHKMSEIHSQIEQKLSLEKSWGSLESQQAPQGGRRGPKRAPGGSKGTPREFQESPKSPPRRSQESLREPPRSQQQPKTTEIITNMVHNGSPSATRTYCYRKCENLTKYHYTCTDCMCLPSPENPMFGHIGTKS